jgi:NTP pyrophosphatase (non-canonical NTP hydrolase)
MTKTNYTRHHIALSVTAQLERAYEKHGRSPWGRHEFYGILKEEVDELWDAIKSDQPIEDFVDEIHQIIAVCVRYLETGDRYRGDHCVTDERRAPEMPTTLSQYRHPQHKEHWDIGRERLSRLI